MRKKITAILTASVIALSLAACGGAGTGAQSGTPEPAAEPASTASAVESKGADSAAADSNGAGSGAAESVAAESAAAGTALSGEETEIQVFIAASLNTVMQEVAAAFNEQYPNVKITYNVDSSGTLLTQIEEGYACDVFFSAAQKQMNKLEQEDGLVVILLGSPEADEQA